jgi:GNAT superfamily N-acetyltransferase
MIVAYPLTKANRIRLATAFRSAPRVDLSIDCVIEAQMGTAFVDDLEQPTTFKIQTGPFFYLAGDSGSPAGQEILAGIVPFTLFMPSTPGWLEAARQMYGPRLNLIDRYKFSPENLSIERLSDLLKASPYKDGIERIDERFAALVWGQEHFVDLSEYDSPEDFCHRGIGYILREGERLCGAAYASLVCSRGIEISVFIEEDRRQRGIATALASRLLLWCLQNQMEPHWDAANPESCKLAMKLGYMPAGSYEAHYLGE